MIEFPEGNAIIYCEGAFGTPNGKTAHGLIRKTKRYQVLSVIDSQFSGQDAGFLLDGKSNNIPILDDIKTAIEFAKKNHKPATHFVIGIAPDGGRLSANARQSVINAIEAGLNVDCGLHDFLTDDNEIKTLAANKRVNIRDVRRTPPRNELHFFSGKIEQVTSLKIAVLGTDSAIGKRTTAWILADVFTAAGYSAELIGTGQTAWMQGARYSIILDSLINDFVSGEIEHAVWSAWNDHHPNVILIEGQGSLMNPAYPGGFEILADGRPELVILQHAPARKEYDGFPGYPSHPLEKQIQAIEIISGRKVVAITINHENMTKDDVKVACEKIQKECGLPAVDVLQEGGEKIVAIVKAYLEKTQDVL